MSKREAGPPEPGYEPVKPLRESMRLALMSRLRTYFFAGIVVIAPISITIYLAWMLVSFVDARVTPLLPARFNPETYLPFALPGLGVVVAVLALILIGAATAGFLGRLLNSALDAVVTRMPVLRTIYGAIKQIIETVLANRSAAFREAVLIEYPRRGIWTIGLVTGTIEGDIREQAGGDVVNVFVPTTPNPTSGFLLFIPRSDVVPLSMSVEDALKLIISGGIVTPQPPAPPAPPAVPETCAEPLEEAAGSPAEGRPATGPAC